LYESGTVRTYLGSISVEDASAKENTLPDSGQGGQASFTKPASLPPKRSYKRGVLGALCLIGVGVFVWTMLMQMDSRVVSQSGGRVKHAQDDSSDAQPVVQRKRKPAKGVGGAAKISGQGMLVSGQKVKSLEDEPIKPGDRLQTEKNGSVSVDMWADAGTVDIEGESDVQFGDEEDNEAPRLELRSGNIWVDVEDPNLEVTSPLAKVQGSVGAKYHLRIALNSTTTLTVHSGSVTLRPEIETDTRLLILGPGERVQISSNGAVKRDFHREQPIWKKE